MATFGASFLQVFADDLGWSPLLPLTVAVFVWTAVLVVRNDEAETVPA